MDEHQASHKASSTRPRTMNERISRAWSLLFAKSKGRRKTDNERLIEEQRKELETAIAAVQNEELRAWLQSREFPYIKNVLAVQRFEERIRKNPDDAGAYISIAKLLHGEGGYSLSLKNFDKGLTLAPDDARGLMARACVYATCPVASLRNGHQAVVDAERGYALAEKTGINADYGWLHRRFLVILACAYAESGDFDKARRTLSDAKAACKARSQLRGVHQYAGCIEEGKPVIQESHMSGWW